MVQICISLMANDVEHVFTHLLAICISFEKCLFSSLDCLLIWTMFNFGAPVHAF